ncbi:MAG: dihydrolipoamide acetyltransferase family protein [Candidatus Auribacterota bacterium]
MAEKILMVALSPTMDQGVITKWRKKQGDTVASGDVLCEVETDKATMDYESLAEGTLLKIIVDEGGKAAVGEAIAVIGDTGEDISALLAEIKSGTSAKGAEPSVTAEPAIEPAQGAKPAPAVPETPAVQPVQTVQSGVVKASPLARKLAEKKGLDLRLIAGSGPDGRIVKRDVEKAQPLAGRIPSLGMPLADENVPVSQKRRIIAERLSASKFSAPHYYLKTQVNADGLISARQSVNLQQGKKVSFNAFLMKYIAEAIKKNTMINASWKGETIVKFGSIDIGLAVALDDGLITPVVRNCGQKGILAIEEELAALIDKARKGALTPDEYTNATFTVSNLGAYGIEEFTAIINPPGSAILAVGEIRKVPVVTENDSIAVQSVLKLTLSCDHRVIDGAVGAAFMRDLKAVIEQPVMALL